MRCSQRPLLLVAAFLSKELHEARGNFCRLFVWTLDRWEGAGEMGAKISPYHQRYQERCLKSVDSSSKRNFYASN